MKPIEVRFDHVAGAVPSVDAAVAMAGRWGISVEPVDPTPTGLQPILGYLNPPTFVELLVPVNDELVRQHVAGADQLLAAARNGGDWTAWFVRSPHIEAIATRHGLEVRSLPAKGERPPLLVLPPPFHDGSLPFVISLGDQEEVEMGRRGRLAARNAANASWRLESLEVGGEPTALEDYLGPSYSDLPVTANPEGSGVIRVTATGPQGPVNLTMHEERSIEGGGENAREEGH